MIPQPLPGRVVAIREVKDPVSASGIIVSTKETKQNSAIVKAVPEDSPVKVDDRIIFKEYSATEITVDGVEYMILSIDDIFGTL